MDERRVCNLTDWQFFCIFEVTLVFCVELGLTIIITIGGEATWLGCGLIALGVIQYLCALMCNCIVDWWNSRKRLEERTNTVEMSESLQSTPGEYHANHGRMQFYVLSIIQTTFTEILTKDSGQHKYISALLKNTWKYNERLGSDSQNLTHSSISIHEILVVNNHKLKEKYSKATKCLQCHNPKEPMTEPILTTTCGQSFPIPDILKSNEVHLFHGTKLANVRGIITEGFDLSHARSGLYGKGIYLAESSEKADQYADSLYNRRNNHLVMIVVRVTMGKVGYHDTTSVLNLLEQGSIGCNQGHSNYNTLVAGLDKRFREFVVYNPDLCYPEYIVVYERKYNADNIVHIEC